MTPAMLLVLAACCCSPLCRAAQSDAEALQGAWQVTSLKRDGNDAPEANVKRMRFSFKGDKLRIKGNSDDNSEIECTFKLDPTKSPAEIDLDRPADENAESIIGVYELKGDELKLCLQQANSADGRPKDFTAPIGSERILAVFKKQP